MDFITEVKREFEDKIGKNLFTKDLLELANKASDLVDNYETTPPEEYESAFKFISDIVMSLDVFSPSNDGVPILENMLDNGQDILICEDKIDDYIEGMFKEAYGVDFGTVPAMFQLNHSCAYDQFTKIEIWDDVYYVPKA